MTYETEVQIYVWLIRRLPSLLVIAFAIGFPLWLWLGSGAGQ